MIDHTKKHGEPFGIGFCFYDDIQQKEKFSSALLTLKVVFVTFLLVCFLSLNESTCETRENVFYFTSKALFVLEKIKV